MCSAAAAPCSASAPRGTSRRRAAWASHSRRLPSVSNGWRRHCRSSCRCGVATMAPTTAIITTFDVGENGERTGELLDRVRDYAALGVHEVHGTLRYVSRIAPIEAIGREVIPAIVEL